jgi:hypothetical protein
MKPYSLLPLLFLVTGGWLTAQVNPIQLGVQLSPTFSYMGTDNNLIEGDGTKLGMKLGLIVEYYFQENYSFHTGININFGSGGKLRYDEQFDEVDIWGASLDETFTTRPPSELLSGATFDYNLQFVEIPLGLTLRTREFGYTRYFVRPSFVLGIVSGSRGSIEGSSAVDSNEKFKINDEVNSLNLSWGIGGGVEYSVSANTSLIGGIGFQSGFLDVTSDKDTGLVRPGRNNGEAYGDDSKGRVNQIIITLGVMF